MKENLKRSFAAVIFDMDGVLLDSEPIYRKIQDNFFAELGFSVSDKEYDEFIGLGLENMWKMIKSKREIPYDIPKLITMNNQKILDFIKDLNDLNSMPNLLEFLEICKKNKLKTAVASSTNLQIVKTILKKLGIHEFFDEIISGEQVENSKPAPDIFLHTAYLLNIPPDKCLVVEDSENGVTAAKSAGMYCIGFNNPNSGKMNLSRADIVVDNFYEITGMFKQ
ncbi:MAG: HAD family phosphatase [Candidatus Cloacimonetes bacterium]|nr:HAD family phosphatase [Candidatus Cloacimonadota bacterium]